MITETRTSQAFQSSSNFKYFVQLSVHMAESSIHSCVHSFTHLEKTLSWVWCPRQGPTLCWVPRFKGGTDTIFAHNDLFLLSLLTRTAFLLTPELTNHPAGETSLSSINVTLHARNNNRSPERKRCRGGNIWQHLGRSRPLGRMHGVFKGEQESARWAGRGNAVCQGTEA